MRTVLCVLLVVGAVASTLSAQDQEQVVPAGSRYTLAPGDFVRISVWGREEYSGQFQVDEEGMLYYPVIGAIDTRPLNVAQLRDTLRAGLGELFANPFVTITPLFRVAVLGHVNSPGLFTVDPTLSVLDLVALAGGARSAGNLDKIQVFRSDTTAVVSYQDAAVRRATLGEIGVRSGDEINVPRKAFAREDWYLVIQLLTLALTTATFIVTVSN